MCQENVLKLNLTLTVIIDNKGSKEFFFILNIFNIFRLSFEDE